MGQGSRGGNGGLTASGGRVREDKEKAKEPKHVPRAPGKKAASGTKPGEKKPSDNKNKNKKKGGRSGGGLRRIPHPRGHGGLGRLLGHLHGKPKSTAKGSKGAKGRKKATRKISTHVPKPKPPRMPKLKAPKEKLTKQRTNKTPN